MPKRIDFSAKDLRQIERLARYHSQEEIAEIMEITSRTLRRKMQTDQRVLSAYKKGKAKLHGAMARTLIFKALGGDTPCLIFYAKTQMGWREVDPNAVRPRDVTKLSDKELEKRGRELGIVR